jgi:RNA polymerase sigma-70 factor, ECF subfamily
MPAEFGSHERVLEALFRAHHRAMCALVYRYLRSQSAAEQVVQDAFLAVWDRRDIWGDTADLPRYLFAVARNRAVSQLRRERVELSWRERAGAGQAASGMSQFSATAGGDPGTDELVDRLRAAVEQLPERARYTLALRLDRQLQNAEIAEVMGITVKAVERNLARAIATLRKILSDRLPAG